MSAPAQASVAAEATEAAEPQDAWDRWFWLWNYYFAVALLGDVALTLAISGLRADSVVAASLVLGIGLVYLGFRRKLPTTEHGGAANWSFIGVQTALFVAACALDPNAGYALFGLSPMIFMTLRLVPAAVLTSVLIATPTVTSVLRYGVHLDELGMQIPVTVMLMAGSVLVGYWLERIILESAKRAELIQQLEASRAEVAALSHEAGVAAERERLAGDIHDTLAQGFTSVLTLVQAAQAKLGPDTPQAVHRHLELTLRTARENLNEARALIAALTPSALGSGSLADALRRLLEETGEQSGARTEYAQGADVRVLPTRVEVVVLRTAQEALANVRKHAAAGTVSLGLSTTDTAVRMVVTDDGRGFDAATVRTGYGLDGMRSRAAQVGGTLEVHSGASEGTRVELEVPL